jgi:hypothetical protein
MIRRSVGHLKTGRIEELNGKKYFLYFSGQNRKQPGQSLNRSGEIS